MATQYVTDSKGATFIAASQRPDGSWRKPRRVKEGFVPQEEVPLYESKGKKIAKQQAELLPAGITKESWEKMKQEQQKLSNPQVASKSGKKKQAAKGKSANQTTDNKQFEINEPVIGNDSALLPSGSNAGVQSNTTLPKTTASVGGKKATKSKSADSKSSESGLKSDQANASNPPVESWVVIGKPKKPSFYEAKKEEVKAKPAPAKKSQNSASSARVPSQVLDSETGMMVDFGGDESDNENHSNSKNSERQQLTKKIKKLRSKFKEAENLVKQIESGVKLDSSQEAKAKKIGEFARDIQALQNQLQTLKVNL